MVSKNEVQFFFNGELHRVQDIEPTTTLLNYLREILSQCGTKEGCAEGDCGACTVVIADVHGGRIQFRSINACICLLPTLDGKALFTVEGLKVTNKEELHPVQKAMVEYHGSQCGFCTPGFIMSLFVLYKSKTNPDRQEINDALSGNLCRCTGYQPIINAANKMYDYAGQLPAADLNLISTPYSTDHKDSISEDERTLIEKLNSIKPSSCLQLTGAGQYFSPVTLSELAELYQQYPDAVILAGGTDVGLWITKQYRELPVIIYIGNVDVLNSTEAKKDYLQFGATVTLTDAFNKLIEYYPELDEIARRFASPPIRNAGTLCGNIANGSPIGDSMPALICLDARVILRCGDAVRSIPLEELYLGYQQKAFKPAEFVEAVQIPLPSAQQYFHSYKISKRFDQDISAVFAAYFLQLDDNGGVETIRICHGGMAATPKRATLCEAFLKGKSWNEQTVEQAVAKFADDYQPITDMRASDSYRLKVAGNLLRRFYFETTDSDFATNVLSYSAQA